MSKFQKRSTNRGYRRSDSDYLVKTGVSTARNLGLRQSKSWSCRCSAIGKQIPHVTSSDNFLLANRPLQVHRQRQNSTGSTDSEEDSVLNMRHLSLTTQSESDQQPIYQASWFDLQRSEQTTLIIKPGAYDWKTLKAELDAFPMLERLELRNVEITDAHLMEGKIFLPNLKEFSFVSTEDTTYDWDEIFFFYTDKSMKHWTIEDIWSIGVNLHIDCNGWYIQSNKSTSKLILDRSQTQAEFGNWGLSNLFQKLSHISDSKFPKYITIGCLVLKTNPFSVPVRVKELNLVAINAKPGVVNEMLENVKDLEVFRYLSQTSDLVAFSSIPDSVKEIQIQGTELDFSSCNPFTKLKLISLTECLIDIKFWINCRIMLPELAVLNLHGCNVQNQATTAFAKQYVSGLVHSLPKLEYLGFIENGKLLGQNIAERVSVAIRKEVLEWVVHVASNQTSIESTFELDTFCDTFFN